MPTRVAGGKRRAGASRQQTNEPAARRGVAISLCRTFPLASFFLRRRMIRVHLTFIVIFYVTVFLAAVAVLWVLEARRRGRAGRRALQFQIRCAICGLEFEDRSDVALPSCPRCGRPNERVGLDRL